MSNENNENKGSIMDRIRGFMNRPIVDASTTLATDILPKKWGKMFMTGTLVGAGTGVAALVAAPLSTGAAIGGGAAALYNVSTQEGVSKVRALLAARVAEKRAAASVAAEVETLEELDALLSEEDEVLEGKMGSIEADAFDLDAHVAEIKRNIKLYGVNDFSQYDAPVSISEEEEIVPEAVVPVVASEPNCLTADLEALIARDSQW